MARLLRLAASALALAAVRCVWANVSESSERAVGLEAVAVGVYGQPSDALTSSLFGGSVLDVIPQKNVTLFEDETSGMVIAARHLGDEYYAPSALSLVFIEKSLMLNEEAVLQRLVSALRGMRALNTTDHVGKRPLVVTLLGTPSAALVEDLKVHITDAWERVLHTDHPLRSNETFELSPHLLLLSGASEPSPAARRAMQEALTLAALSAQHLEALTSAPLSHPPTLAAISIDSQLPDLAAECREATRAGLRRALQRIGELVDDLNADASQRPQGFAEAVEDVLHNAQQALAARLSAYTLDRPLVGNSRQLVRWAHEDLQRRAMLTLERFHQRQLALLRLTVVTQFNSAVKEVEVSTGVMGDLRRHRDDALRSFAVRSRTLLPAALQGAALLRASERTVAEDLRVTLDEYLREREQSFQLMGVVARGRKPVELSMHVLAAHPLGRDYRQDPLGHDVRDRLLFDARDCADAEAPTAAAVRKRTREKADQKTRSEFAREMMMLPLSLKSPLAHLGGGRPRLGPEPPKKDVGRSVTGPERFVDFTVAPMPDVERALRVVQEHAGASSWRWPRSVVDLRRVLGVAAEQAADLSPSLRAARYRHPRYNYGSAYSPVVDRSASSASKAVAGGSLGGARGGS